MMEVKLSSDKNFREALIDTLINEINQLSLCLYPIVTELEVTQFINDHNTDIDTKKSWALQHFGSNNLQDVFYYVKEYIKKRWFNEILRYVNYERRSMNKNSHIEIDENKTIED